MAKIKSAGSSNKINNKMKLVNIIREIISDYKTNWDNNWDVPIPIIGFTKNDIRNVVKNVFGNPIFGTAGPNSIKIKGDKVVLKIEIANAGSEDNEPSKGKKVAEELSKIGNKPVKFIKYIIHKKTEDISGYEPRYISHGTMSEITTLYLILST